jgi:hypothetical protein
MKGPFLFFIFMVLQLNAQVGFQNGSILIDLTHYSSDLTSITSSDINNDGFKELIVGSTYDNTIMLYKNINGNIQDDQRQIIYDNSQANFDSTYDITSTDLDSDGLKDIIVVSGFEDKIFWFKNLGNYNFGSSIIINSAIDNPKAVISQDIDNDGDNDLIVGSYFSKNVTLFKNNGNGTFSNQQIIYTLSSAVNNIILKDLDNNGYKDIISGHDDGSIFWVKNIDGVNFSPKIYLTSSANDGTGFDFIDINNDTYLDIVFSSNYDDKLKYSINQNGNTFNTNSVIIDNNIIDPYQVKTIDFDNDGILDILISTYSNDKIGWYKNNNNGTFSNIIQISNNIFNPKDFIIEDLNNNGVYEIISSSYERNISSRQKLSIFEKDTFGVYNEKIINFYFGAVNSVKIADLNNDGNNDIISAFGSILWNENKGNNVFTSQKLISSNILTSFVYDIEIKDLNNDNFLDIVGITSNGLEVYKNNGNETFDLVYNLPLSDSSREIELADINNDGKLDIILTFFRGADLLAKIINNGNFGFQSMISINFSDYGYKPNKIRCGDMDNDGDIDIVTSSTEYSRIQLLKNDGTGNFSYNLIQESISTDPIDLGDIDYDGDLDIITAGSYSYSNQSLSLLKNYGNGTFNNPIVIDYQSCKSLNLADINNDGNLDIVGTSYEYYSPYDEKIFYYLGNGSTFANKVIIESLGDSLSLDKNLCLGDLNNDNKIDIVSSYYFINTVKYFLNNSTLSIEEFDTNKDNFIIFPNPSNDKINWLNEFGINRIIIYNLLGEVILDKTVNSSIIDISYLEKGVYIVKGISDKSIYSSKFIVN